MAERPRQSRRKATPKRRNDSSRTASNVSPQVVPPAKAPKPIAETPKAPAPTPKPLVRQVVLRNATGQMLTASVVDDDGREVEVRVQARATHGPVSEAHLTEYTRRLAELGHLKITAAT